MAEPRRSLMAKVGPVSLAGEVATTVRGTGAELRRALHVLPRRVAAGVTVVLVAVLLPSVLSVMEFVGALEAAPALRWLATHGAVAWGGVAVIAVVALLVVEPPRAASVRGYARQLRERAERLRKEYLAASGGQGTTKDNG